ncbi:MAG TPA: DUF1289 domain-containing protein [Rhodanobacteraceae bacterium]|nr:DUF1289 domain-containing protein [Rhodanobacteraceae bacterium]
MPPQPISSPCTGVCRLDANGLCEGCLRSGDEIAGWLAMSEDQRVHIIDDVIPSRKAARRLAEPDSVAVEASRLRRAVRALDDPPEAPGRNAAGSAFPADSGGARQSAAVLVPLVCRAAGLSVLFTVRTERLRQHAGQVSFPGGRIEPGDADAVAAALRETEEETGIAPAHVCAFGYLDRFETISGYCVVPVTGFVNGDYRAEPDGVEVAELFEVPLAFILAHNRFRHQRVEWRGRAREFVEFDWHGRRVWGATAAILLNLVGRLEATA